MRGFVLPTISFAGIWVCVMAFVVSLHFHLLGWYWDEGLLNAVLPYGFGALASGLICPLLISKYANNREPVKTFAFSIVCIAFFTASFTLLYLVLQHRLYFSQWHSSAFSITWAFQVFFTALGTVALFAISGIRPLLPYGFFALIFVSWLFSRGRFNTRR